MRNPGQDAVREILRSLWHEWQDDRVAGLAAEVAFFGLLGLFPALLVVAAALGSLEAVIGHDLAAQAEAEVLDFFRRVLTDEASSTLDAIDALFEGPDAGVLTVGVVVAVWAAARGFGAVIDALDVAYDLEERRTWLSRKLTAVALALGTAVVGTLILAVLVVGPLLGTGREIAEALGAGQVFATLWNWLRWPTVVLGATLWAATVFHLAPNHRTPWRWDVPGSLLTAVCWGLASVAFRVYLALAAGGNPVLGTLGGSLIVVLWLYVMSIGLLLGGELNAILIRRFGVPQQARRSLRPSRARWPL